MPGPCLRIAAATFTFLCLSAWSDTLIAGSRIVPNPELDGIARITIEDGQPIVQYHPQKCAEELGAGCGFVLKHEEGHIVLGHVKRDLSKIGPDDIRRMEMESDCYAARESTEEEFLAILKHHEKEGHAEPRPFHGTGFQRVARIKNARYRNICEF